MAVWLLADAAWLVDSTPVECTRSCESARRSELAVRRVHVVISWRGHVLAVL
jgi:hypothetical protein